MRVFGFVKRSSYHHWGVRILGLTAIPLLLVLGCAALTQYGKLEKSARDNYLSKNYDRAVFDVVQSLKINPEYDQAQDLVKMVVPLALDYHLNKIQEAKSGAEKFQWDIVVAEYGALIKLNEAIKSLPILTNKKTKETIKFEVTSYSKELSEAKNNAAEAHYREGVLLSKNGTSRRGQAATEFITATKYVPGYKDTLALAAEGYYQEGNRLLKQEDIDIQKQAAKEFKTAMSYVSGYKDSASLYERARKGGLKRIAIIPFDDKSGKKGQYGAVAEEVIDGIVSDIMNDPSATEFLEIISRDQLERVMAEHKLGMSGIVDEKTAVEAGKILGVQEILTGQITNLTVSPERTMNKQIPEKKTLCRDVAYRDEKGKEKSRSVCDVEVSATVTIYSREAGASITGSYKIIDVKTGKLKKSDSFTGKYAFLYEWAKYSGDQGALSTGSQNLASKNEQGAPVNDEMVNKAKKNLMTSLASALKSYAR